MLATPCQADQLIIFVAPSGSPAKFCPGMSGGPKFTVLLSTICCSALHITLFCGLLAEPGVLLQHFEGYKSLFPFSSPTLGHFRRLILHLLFRICIKFRRFRQSLTGVLITVSARLPVRVLWSAEQHILDSTTLNLGTPEVPGHN